MMILLKPCYLRGFFYFADYAIFRIITVFKL